MPAVDGSARRDAAAWVFVDDLEALELDPADAHHLGRVLRLRKGEAVVASDGRGRRRACAVTATGPALALEAVGPILEDPQPMPRLTVGFSLVKGDRPELVVQKLTELGVDRILPLAADRSVVRWEGEKAVRNVARLRLVARAAAMQCGRSRLPEMSELATVAAVAASFGPTAARCDLGGAALDLARPALLVGPEGGWSRSEVACGLPVVGLGPTTLRAETAAIAAGVLLTALRAATVR